ncbi:hypothetical protein ACO0LF_13805 [Undibacterium sp. Di27W]|uniref:hypothetical protein n=1 Tax=Undibacterium sp. Di27W TaxID=3413036 RepID=UPI003BF1B7D1
MKILIISSFDDADAAAVSWGLKKLGSDAVLWDPTRFPRHATASWSISDQQAGAFAFQLDGHEYAGVYDKVWFRRATLPVAMENSHPADLGIIKKESTHFFNNIYSVTGGEHALWVNDIHAARRSNSKMLQLEIARSLGFSIPNTMIGNDARQVRDFFHANDKQMVRKSFSVGGWTAVDGSAHIIKTAKVKEEQLQHDMALMACPSIYQNLVAKQFEARVTVIGNRVIAAKIDSQRDEKTVDWRYDLPKNKIPVEPLELPEEVTQRCLSLCQQLGLVFACIDLIFSTSGEYVFLELNEAGQFLWLERYHKDLTMLDSFCRYLAYGNTQANPALPQLAFDDFFESDEFLEFEEINKKMQNDGILLINE